MDYMEKLLLQTASAEICPLTGFWSKTKLEKKPIVAFPLEGTTSMKIEAYLAGQCFTCTFKGPVHQMYHLGSIIRWTNPHYEMGIYSCQIVFCKEYQIIKNSHFSLFVHVLAYNFESICAILVIKVTTVVNFCALSNDTSAIFLHAVYFVEPNTILCKLIFTIFMLVSVQRGINLPCAASAFCFLFHLKIHLPAVLPD